MSDLLTEARRAATVKDLELIARTRARLVEALEGSYGPAVHQLEVVSVRSRRTVEDGALYEFSDVEVRLRGHDAVVALDLASQVKNGVRWSVATSLTTRRTWFRLGRLRLTAKRRLTDLEAAEVLSA